MTLMLPLSAKERLLNKLKFWVAKPPKTLSGSFKLKYWQCMTGWFNWALNIYPLLCPALNNMYVKMGGKQNREQQVYINNAIQSDLMWAVTHIKKSDGKCKCSY